MKNTRQIDDYEDSIKAVSRWISTARAAAISAESIKDKARFVRLERQLQDAWKALRLNYYEMQDAFVAAEKTRRCGECGNITKTN